jgi:hypothetical protein
MIVRVTTILSFLFLILVMGAVGFMDYASYITDKLEAQCTAKDMEVLQSRSGRVFCVDKQGRVWRQGREDL